MEVVHNEFYTISTLSNFVQATKCFFSIKNVPQHLHRYLVFEFLTTTSRESAVLLYKTEFLRINLKSDILMMIKKRIIQVGDAWF